MFLALHASFTSFKSLFNIGIIDSDMHTIILISSKLILKYFNGVHNNSIVLAIPHYTSASRIYNSNVAY